MCYINKAIANKTLFLVVKSACEVCELTFYVQLSMHVTQREISLKLSSTISFVPQGLYKCQAFLISMQNQDSAVTTTIV